MTKSKLTTKGRTTIPQPVRLALGLQPGDAIAYAIEAGRAVLTKLPSRSTVMARGQIDPFTSFAEWNSETDAHAFVRL